MRILFMGTPEFAVESLRVLAESGEHEIVGVFCNPDRPKGRGHKLEPPPVKVLAQTLSLSVYQPESLRDGEAERVARTLAPDLSVVVAYGRLLPQPLIDVPRLGTINVHASLLPRWRGSAPIQHSIMTGDTETGVTIQQMRLELDAGDIISRRTTVIAERETYGELYDRLKTLGAELLLETLRTSPFSAEPQVGAPTFAPPITRDDCKLDVTRPASELVNRVRALCPKPGATLTLGEQTLKIYRARIGADASDGALTVPCGDATTLVIEELQAPGGKRMKTDDYLRGNNAPRFG